jgi:hypothetical protein
MVVCSGLSRFEEQPAEVIGLNHNKAISEREEPPQIPIPFSTFNSEGDALFVAFFVEDLERGFFSYALGGERIHSDRSCHGCGGFLQAPEKIAQRKAFVRLESLRERRYGLDSIGPEIPVILPRAAPGNEVPAIRIIG